MLPGTGVRAWAPKGHPFHPLGEMSLLRGMLRTRQGGDHRPSHQKSHRFRFVIGGIHSVLFRSPGNEVLVLPLSSVKGRFESLTFNPQGRGFDPRPGHNDLRRLAPGRPTLFPTTFAARQLANRSAATSSMSTTISRAPHFSIQSERSPSHVGRNAQAGALDARLESAAAHDRLIDVRENLGWPNREKRVTLLDHARQPQRAP
jgi:hypothetical protein